jgi:hypothetical protein
MIRSLPFPKRLSAALALMLVVSCDNPVCGCPPSRDAGFLYGRVTDAAGTPVADARVEALYAFPGCVEPVEPMGQARSGADGRYRMAVYTVFHARPGDCLRAFALPPAQSSLRGSDTVAFSVEFAVDVPKDSARVDLVLRAP